MIRALIVLLTVWLANPQQADAQADPLRFLQAAEIDMAALQQHMMLHITKQPEVKSVTPIGRDQINVLLNDGRQFSIGLTNMRETLSRAADRRRHLESDQAFVESMIRPKATAADAADSLLLVVRETAFLESIDKQQQGAAGSPGSRLSDKLLKRPFLPGTSVLVVVDSPQSSRYVTIDDVLVKERGVNAVFDLAAKNMARRFPQIRVTERDGLHVLVTDPDYNSSILLNRAHWQAASTRLGGALIVAAPTRGLVLYARAGDEKTTQLLRNAMVQATDAYRVSRKLFRFDDGKWSVVD